MGNKAQTYFICVILNDFYSNRFKAIEQLYKVWDCHN